MIGAMASAECVADGGCARRHPTPRWATSRSAAEPVVLGDVSHAALALEASGHASQRGKFARQLCSSFLAAAPSVACRIRTIGCFRLDLRLGICRPN